MIRVLRIGPIILVLALMAVLAVISISDLKERKGADEKLLLLVSRATVSESYLLQKDAWTTYSIPPDITVLRVLVNANILKNYQPLSDQFLEHSVQYQVLDRKGMVLKDQVYHQRSRQTRFFDKETGDDVPAYFYLLEGSKPLDGRIIMVNLGGLEGASLIRFRLAEKDSRIEDVVMRIYAAERHAEERFRRIWLRMTDYQKERLTAGNVYPTDLLSEEETHNILRNLTQPLGPAGIKGRDYSTRKLYILKETVDREYDIPVMPAGLYIEKGYKGLFPVPAGGGRIRLSFMETGFASPRKGDRINIRWYGKSAFKRSGIHLAWPGKDFDFSQSFDEGVLELEPSFDTVVRSFLVKGSTETEITPETLYQRAFSAEKGLPVEYELNHEKGMATPFRVDLRILTGPARMRTSGHARYTILDGQGRSIKQGRLDLNQKTSLYDRYAGKEPGVRVSDPVSYYFSLPAPAKRFRLEAEDPVMVSAYNRPPGLVREIHVPEDYFISYRNMDKQPSWFYLSPVDDKKMFEENRSVLLTIQFRPPDDQPDLISGIYAWEDFHPEGKWRARHMLTPWDSMGTYRPGAVSALYHRIQPNITSHVVLAAEAGIRLIQPKLVFFRRGDSPVPYDVISDGSLIFRGRMVASSGETMLPAIQAGGHEIKIVSAGEAEFYMSNCVPAGDTMILRLANRMDNREMSFIYEKKDAREETLSARLHVPAARKGPSVIRVTVERSEGPGTGPWLSLTMPERRYYVQPAPGGPVPVLNTPGETVDQGQVFFIPFGNDMPPGKYRVRYKMEEGEESYLIFYKMTPGLAEKREIFMEKAGVRIEAYE